MQDSSQRLISQLKALADPVRMRLLALCVRGECTVSELTAVTGQSQPRISQHLKLLGDAGLVERFRDGNFAYFRVPLTPQGASQRRRLFALLPADEPVFERDLEKLVALRSGAGRSAPDQSDAVDRRLHRSLIELSVATPLGDLLDIGSGRGRLLKLLGSRAKRVVGVDIDADARQLARAELLLAGIDNCSLRDGDMYELPFADGEFDTVILDDVLADAARPLEAIREASRLLKAGGRLLLLTGVDGQEAAGMEKDLQQWCRTLGLRLATPRRVPHKEPQWLLAVATAADGQSAAA